MDALDGNAIAGALYDLFGEEMTLAESVCAYCGAVRPLAELRVYLRAPGTVVRCTSCASIAIVLVEIRGITCVDVRGLATLRSTT
jgi:hypothetical protein